MRALALAPLGLATLALALLSGCGKEVGRVPFAAEGKATGKATLAAGEVAFWTDIDLEYEGDAALGYEVELRQGGAKIADAKCDALGRFTTKTMWTESHLGSSHKRRGNGKMACKASVPAAGETEIAATLSFSQKPTSVTLRKADLVLRQ